MIFIIISVYAGMYRVFEKAGIVGWKCFIPIYNTLLILWLVGKPEWWLLVLLIPFVNIIIVVTIHIELAERFSQGRLFGVGLVFLPFIFYPILGFGSAKYYPPGTGRR